jgi:hypothetical protein
MPITPIGEYQHWNLTSKQCTYHKQAGRQHCQSSGIPRFLPFQDHQFQHGRPRCAAKRSGFFCVFVFGYSTYSNNALRSNQLDELICDRALAIALGISLEVAKIANMAGLVGWSTVCLSEWIDC